MLNVRYWFKFAMFSSFTHHLSSWIEEQEDTPESAETISKLERNIESNDCKEGHSLEETLELEVDEAEELLNADCNENAGSKLANLNQRCEVDVFSSRALAGAKTIGSFLYAAGKSVCDASMSIMKTFEDNVIIGDFNHQQNLFIEEHQARIKDLQVPPWCGCRNEDQVREECLNLSSSERNFLRSPPAGVDVPFNYEYSFPVALAIMAEDPNLERMRFALVPKIINEENFWRNYFYRVNLICLANQRDTPGEDAVVASAT